MRLMSWGANSCGQLGQGITSEECLVPSPVSLENIALNVEDISDIVGGGEHSLLLTHKGTVFGCGSNAQGQLLDLASDETNFKMFKNWSEHYKATQISTKWDTSFVVDINCNCFGWGSNKYNELGCSNPSKNKTKDITLCYLGVVQVAAGLRHTLILLKSGDVLSAGDNRKGQLGRILSSDLNDFQPVEGLTGIKQIAAGQNHSLAVSRDNKIFGWGCNKFGQLGVDPSVTDRSEKPIEVPLSVGPIQKLLSGWTHSGVLTDNGELVNWGRNRYCQLGFRSTPFEYNPKTLDSILFKDVAFGAEHNLGITMNDALVTWGWNEHGNCGTGNKADVPVPQQLNVGKALKIGVGSGQSFAIVA